MTTTDDTSDPEDRRMDDLALHREINPAPFAVSKDPGAAAIRFLSENPDLIGDLSPPYANSSAALLDLLESLDGEYCVRMVHWPEDRPEGIDSFYLGYIEGELVALAWKESGGDEPELAQVYNFESELEPEAWFQDPDPEFVHSCSIEGTPIAEYRDRAESDDK